MRNEEVITTRVKPEVKDSLAAIALRRGTTRSKLASQWITERLVQEIYQKKPEAA